VGGYGAHRRVIEEATMTTHRARIVLALVGLLATPGALAGQVHTELKLTDPAPTSRVQRCGAGVRRHEGAWSLMGSAAAMDGATAVSHLRALQDSLAREARLHPDDVSLQYLLAAVIGARAELESGRMQVAAAKELYLQTRTVLELDPDHPGALHILGRLHYAVLRMSRVKRFIATRVLGASELSGANWDDARRLLEAAVVGDPCVPEHHYELARLYVDQDRIPLARERLHYVVGIVPHSARAQLVIQRATELLQSLERGT
jgi:hypothetical protein